MPVALRGAIDIAIGDARYVGERPVVLKRRDQASRSLLAFAAYISLT